MSDDMVAIHLGQAWDNSLFTVPSEFESFGWHMSGRSPFLVVGDPDGLVDPDAIATTPVRLGFAQFGPLLVCAAKCPALPGPLVESTRPYLVGDEEPEITIEPGDHILWQMVTVSRGIVTNIRAFTTSPQVTRWLRRAFAEQRAAGPITYAESDAWIARWQAEHPDAKSVWKRIEVTCVSGD